jgi:hypothetical protein
VERHPQWVRSYDSNQCLGKVADMFARLILTLGALLLAGCVNPQAFQPPPSAEELWHKTGATNDEITKALLECGSVSPRTARFKNEPRMTPNENVLMRLCMEANGFTSDFENSSKGFCKRWSSESLQACRPGTPAPARDPNKRISSEFCHAFPRAKVCIP